MEEHTAHSVTEVKDYREQEDEQAQRDQLISNYLIENPSFFNRHPDIITKLLIPHETSGAISLISFQQEKLRDRVISLEEEVTQLLSIATRNDQLFHLYAEIQLMLLQEASPRTIDSCLKILSQRLNLTVSLRLFADVIPALPLQWLLDPSGYRDVEKSHIHQTEIYLGHLTEAESLLFFDHLSAQVTQMSSFAILPLNQASRHLGFLAFSSTNSNHFREGQGTLIIDQFATLFSTVLGLMKHSGKLL